MLLNHTNFTFNLRHVFIGSGGIQDDSIRGELMLQWNELSVHEHCLNLETSGSIYGSRVLARLNKLRKLARGNILRCSELEVVTDSSKKWSLVNKEQVAKQRHMFTGR